MGPRLWSVAGDGGSGLKRDWCRLRVRLEGKSEEQGLIITGKGISNAVQSATCR